MTKQQHLNHSPPRQEFKAISTARQLNNAARGCKHCRGCKTPHRGSLAVTACHLLGTTSPCAQRQWEGRLVPAAAHFPSLAAPFPPQHELAPNPTLPGVSVPQPPSTRQDLPPESKAEAKQSVPEQVFPQRVKCH